MALETIPALEELEGMLTAVAWKQGGSPLPREQSAFLTIPL